MTADLTSKDKHTQFGIVGQIRDVHDHHRSGDTPEGDLAVIRLKNEFNLSTPYVQSVQLMESVGTLMEVNETKSGEILLLAGYEKERDAGVQTRVQALAQQSQNKKALKPLKLFEITVEYTGKCIDKYVASYQTYYFNVFCGKLQKKTDIIPCHYEGSGLVKRVVDAGGIEANYLFGVYSSNSALAKTEGTLMEKNKMTPPPCTSSDLMFISRYAHLKRWAISNQFCDKDLAMCLNDRCRPWNDLCNGKSECDDGSDETGRICHNQNKECGSNQFRCEYGACIDKKLICDGIRDCKDGSDEDKEGICKGKKISAATTLSTTSGKNTPPKSKSTVTSTPSPSAQSQTGTVCEGIKEQQSVTAHCNHPERPGLIPCGDPVPIGTTAVLRNKEVTITCGRDAKWSRSTRLTC